MYTVRQCGEQPTAMTIPKAEFVAVVFCFLFFSFPCSAVKGTFGTSRENYILWLPRVYTSCSYFNDFQHLAFLLNGYSFFDSATEVSHDR